MTSKEEIRTWLREGMKLKDMPIHVRYTVTKGGSMLKKGDEVWLDLDGSLRSLQSGGWLMPQEWTKLRNEVAFDEEYYKKEIEKLKAKIKICESLIKEYGVTKKEIV